MIAARRAAVRAMLRRRGIEVGVATGTGDAVGASWTCCGGNAMPGIEPPVTYAWWVRPSALLLVLALAWLLWLLQRTRPARPDAPDPRRAVQQDWGGAVAELHGRFLRGELDLRALHLALAGLMREFGSDHTGRDLRPMTRAEIAEELPKSGLGELLGRYEQPSFARDPQVEAQESVDRTLEVISRW